MTGRVHSIESFGTVDGPGLRFVIFLQGCPMRCLYCHNPDTWNTTGGTEMTVDEVLNLYKKNRSFYKTGGITVTGGEPMLQLDFIDELFAAAKAEQIHTCIDTSGIVFNSDNKKTLGKIDSVLKNTDLILLDIKHIDDSEHIHLTAHSNQHILEFAHYLEKKGVPVWIRHVVVPGITYNEEYLKKIGRFVGTLSNVESVEVLPYHTLGVSKYETLGLSYPLKGTTDLSKEDLKQAEQWLLEGIRSAKTSQ